MEVRLKRRERFGELAFLSGLEGSEKGVGNFRHRRNDDDRMTLELKCADLDASQLAARSVPPSTMSLLGLVRHMAHVERVWFKIRCAQLDVPKLYQTDDDPDGDFNGAVADPAVVNEAWARWREEVAFAEKYVDDCDDLSSTFVHPRDGSLFSMRELLVHMIEEYARHNGHADLLRECVDGRVGI